MRSARLSRRHVGGLTLAFLAALLAGYLAYTALQRGPELTIGEEELAGWTPEPRPAAPTPRERIDLNIATESEIDALPGIGPTTAREILRLRQELGGFRDLDELQRIPGIGPKTVERLRDYVRL